GLLWSTVCSITGRLLCADPLFIGCASFGWLLYQCPVEVHAQPFAFRNRRNLERCIRVCRNIGFVVQEKREIVVFGVGDRNLAAKILLCPLLDLRANLSVWIIGDTRGEDAHIRPLV